MQLDQTESQNVPIAMKQPEELNEQSEASGVPIQKRQEES